MRSFGLLSFAWLEEAIVFSWLTKILQELLATYISSILTWALRPILIYFNNPKTGKRSRYDTNKMSKGVRKGDPYNTWLLTQFKNPNTKTNPNLS